ncbi:hypothetical protein ACFU8X_29190 [Brevibacillus porteri]|uniref:hypothetical protein n=1 Tax=Brevibacillus porteri TaxID=2126350 RepID=UPI00370C0B8B
MKEYIANITFEEAKELAEQLAFQRLNNYRKGEHIKLLREDYLEAECCWFFFRNKEIEGPDDGFRLWDCAYSISKKGECGTVIDYSDYPEKLNEYILQFSDRCKEKGY